MLPAFGALGHPLLGPFESLSRQGLFHSQAYLMAAPRLIPLVLEANLPDEDLFKKFLVGTRFTQDELYTLHSSVLELERFLQVPN